MNKRHISNRAEKEHTPSKACENGMFFWLVDREDWRFDAALEFRLESREFVYNLASGKLKYKCLCQGPLVMHPSGNENENRLTCRSSVR